MIASRTVSASLLLSLAIWIGGSAAALEQAGAPPAAASPAYQTRFDDSLLAPAHAALAGRGLGEGKPRWSASAGLIVTAEGATTSAALAGGGSLPIPAVSGTISIHAEMSPAGCGFAGLALGHGNLDGDFWNACEVLFQVRDRGYALMVGKADLIGKADATLVKPGFNQVELVIDTVAKTVTARLNGVVVLDAKPLPAGSLAHPLTQAGFRFNEPVTAGAPSIRNLQVTIDSMAVSGMEPVDIAGFLIAPDRPSTLRWTVAARGPSERVPYALIDYAGRTVATGDAGFSADGRVEASVTVPRGFYELVFAEAHQTFGVLALEPHADRADPFFGMDAGLSWLELRPAMRIGLVAALKRSGIAAARERLNIQTINPASGTYEWQGREKRYDEMRRAYREAGVEVLELMTGEPNHFEPGLNRYFPQNLVETARTWSAFTTTWGDGWAAGEVGNEPDLATPGMPADQYVVMAKAAAYAADHTAPRRPVVGGVFASVPRGSYYDACAANGLLDAIDALSFHQYDRAPAMQDQVQICRDYLAAAGRPGMPLWLTECGHPWVLGPGRPPRDQDADSAREISAKAVEARACGVTRFFPFVLPFYEEGGIKSFSMFGREVTPLRSFAAYAWCASTLSGCEYLGDLRIEDPQVRLARVFSQADGGAVAVLYTDAVGARTTVRLPVAPLRITGADGRILPSDAAGAMPVPDGLGYAWFSRSALGTALKTDTRAALLSAASRTSSPARAPASPIVLQFSYQAASGQISKRAYHIDRARAAALPLTIRVQNLGDVPLTVVPTLHLPGPGSAAFAHPPITVDAHAIVEASWTVDASAALDCCEERLVRITATCDQANAILPLALPFLVEGELNDILARFPRQEPLPIADLTRWKVRVGGGGRQVFSSPDGQGWRMDLAFTRTGDAWAYPYFTMPRPIDPKTSSGVVLRGRVLKPGGHNIMFMLVDGSFEIPANDLFIPDGKWHSVYIPFEQLRYSTSGMQNEPLHLDRISTLAVGLGSTDLEQAMEVSALFIVGGSLRSEADGQGQSNKR